MAVDEVISDRTVLRVSLMAWLLTSILVVLIVFDPKAASATNPLQLHGALQRDHTIGIVAHRGAATVAPENTLAAFQLAIEQDVDFVETDVQLTSDGVAVLLHDPDVDRTTNGAGPLSQYTYEQLRTLDAGSWFAPEFAGEQVPTLEEFVSLLGPAPTRAFVELKGDWPAERVIETIDLLRSHHLVHRIVLASFERDTLEVVREFAPEYATILLTRDLDAKTVDYAIDLQVNAVCARDKLLAKHSGAIDNLRHAGIGTIAYTLNTPKQWKRAAKQQIDFFVTDDAAALTAWRDGG